MCSFCRTCFLASSGTTIRPLYTISPYWSWIPIKFHCFLNIQAGWPLWSSRIFLRSASAAATCWYSSSSPATSTIRFNAGSISLTTMVWTSTSELSSSSGWKTGALESASAISCFLPATHSTLNVYPSNFEVIRCNRPFWIESKSRPFKIPRSGLWSVFTMNSAPSKYKRHFSTAHWIPKHSSSTTA